MYGHTKEYVAPPPGGNGDGPDPTVLRQAYKEAEAAKVAYFAEEARRAAFAPIAGGTIDAELTVRREQQRSAAPSSPIGLMSPEQARAVRSSSSIGELESTLGKLAHALENDRVRKSQFFARVDAAKAKAARLRASSVEAGQRRTDAAEKGDVTGVEKATAEIAEVEAEAKRADETAVALEQAAKALDTGTMERQHADAAGKLLDEQARRAVAHLTAELPAVAELVRKKLGALLGAADTAIAACACAGRAPANLYPLDASAIAAVLHRALVEI